MLHELESALKAAGDPTRARILKLLEQGPLCVCQVQTVLRLAPSTVSKHLALLKAAGLVLDERQGRWIQYALAGGERNPYASEVLTLLRGRLDDDPRIADDRRRLGEVRMIPLETLCSIPPAERLPYRARPERSRGIRDARRAAPRVTTRGARSPRARGGAAVEGTSAAVPGTPTPAAAPHLLFVCVENSCRSQMAEGFARSLGAGRVEAHSAGSRPSGRVNPRAVRFMREKDVDLSRCRSKGLDELPGGVTWDWIVTMGCGDACPSLPARHRLDWDLPDPKALDDAGFRAVRDRIEEEVRALVAEATRADAEARP